MKTQNEALLEYLREGNTITSLESREKLGIMILSARVKDLRDAGHRIKDRFIDVPSRYGQTRVKQYWLADAEEQGDMFGKSKPKHKGSYSL